MGDPHTSAARQLPTPYIGGFYNPSTAGTVPLPLHKGGVSECR